MSLILKALKKSEQERQMGRVPGLDSQPMHMPREPQSERKYWPWLLLVTVFLVAGAWWLGQESAREEALSPPVLPEPVVSSSEPPSTTSEPAPAEKPEPSAQASTKPSQTSAPTAKPKKSPTPSVEVKPAVTRQPTPPKPSESLVPPPQPIEPTVAAPPAPTSTPTPSPAGEPANDVAAKPRLPLVSELPVAERQSLPTLKQSMHIYASEPVRRAIIIDGKRYAEGGVIQPGLTVETIRRDGTVLRWDGRQLLLTRP